MFKLKKSMSKTEKTYKLFLNHIDDLSAARLRGIDMSFEILKHKFSELDVELSEISCNGNTFIIKRNQNGFYVDESRALFSDEDYINYQYGLSFYKKYKKDFVRLHQLLLEKEHIMNGYYVEKKMSREELRGLSSYLGYTSVREQVLYEENPFHPSKEFGKTVKYLNMVRKRDVNLEELMLEVLGVISEYFKDNIELEIKRIRDKYEMDFDDSFGVLLIDNDIGDMRMLYEIDGFDIKKADYDMYLCKECPYLEIYLRIIAKCLKLQEF